MSDAAVLEKVEALTKTVERLQERVEELEDLRDLQAAIAENGHEPLIPWEQAKADLELGCAFRPSPSRMILRLAPVAQAPRCFLLFKFFPLHILLLP